MPYTVWYGSCGTKTDDDIAPCDDYESQTSCQGEDPLAATTGEETAETTVEPETSPSCP